LRHSQFMSFVRHHAHRGMRACCRHEVRQMADLFRIDAAVWP
jgi:hypothetical protein